MIIKLYLFLYNFVQFLGWSYILFLLVQHYASGGSYETVWEKIRAPLIIFQNAAAIEVLHALIGLVRSPVPTTLMQVLSRVALTAVAYLVPQVQTHWGVTLMVGSWAAVEVVRYLYFAVNQYTKELPYALLWLRYSLFMILYPSGITGELLVLYNSLSYFESTGLEMFHIGGFGLKIYYVAIFGLFTYVPGGPYMYYHMLKQRSKYLNPNASGETKSSGATSPKRKTRKAD